MTTFIQLHMLNSYAGVLLNRDDAGHAKSLPYGNSDRTRISSQCLKRHWRMADGPMAISRMDGYAASVRTRNAFVNGLSETLENVGVAPDDAKKIVTEINILVYGDKASDSKQRQLLLLSQSEIDFAISYAVANRDHLLQASALKDKAKIDAAAKKVRPKFWAALRDATSGSAGTIAALFGRMVTADKKSNVDAAVHVAHAFTVHGVESEVDYFTVVDDLAPADDTGAGHINESELTSGLFYTNVVIDIGVLLRNLGGHNDEFAAELVRRFIHVIATTSPGAKRGSTAPYGFASFLLAEAGTRQPRSLAEAWRTACAPTLDAAQQALTTHVQQVDAMYGKDEQRAVAALRYDGAQIGAENMPLNELATWAGSHVRTGE